MSDPNDPNLNLGVGGGIPPVGGGPSLEDDEKALKKGNTSLLIIGGVAALAVLAGLMVLLASEQPDQYGTIGRQVNGMKSEHFDGFWGCALPSQRIDRLRSSQELRDAIQKRASGRPGAYAQHVRQQCLVKLNEHSAPLQSLIAPEDLQAQLSGLGDALGELRAAWDGYLEYLDHAESYDETAAAPHLGKIAKGWYDYKHAHSQINTTIRTHLNE